MRSPSRIWPDLSGSRLFRRSARSCSISRIYSSQVVTRASAGAGLRSHHYAACQSIRLDRSRNGPNGNSNIPCATEAPSAIRAPTGGAIPGRNRGGRRVSVSGSNAEPRGRCAGATAARAGFRRRRGKLLPAEAFLLIAENSLAMAARYQPELTNRETGEKQPNPNYNEELGTVSVTPIAAGPRSIPTARLRSHHHWLGGYRRPATALGGPLARGSHRRKMTGAMRAALTRLPE